MSLTPSKPRGVALPVAGDDHTDVTSPPAPWDGRDEDDEVLQDPDGTKQTDIAIKAAAAAPVPTPTNKHAPAPGRDDYDLEPGTALGEYRIEGKIGQGGMGVVFSAVHPMIGKRAAIKILKKEMCADPHTIERFIDEARVVNEIGHPNIVDVFAFGEMPDGRRYFVMEWLKGETLRSRIARSKLGAGEVSAIIRPLARALEAAHEKGVIHRDLKPDNVFLVDVRGEVPTVKLLDFGIAKLARNEHRVEKTATGAIVGTPQYIAPEQAKGYAIDHRADIYALGGIIYELLTGRPPFVADNAMEMVAKHLMETPLPPSHFTASVPPEFDDLVLRMLAKTPDGRPTLAEVCDVAERIKVRASTQTPFGADGPVRAPTAVPVPATPLPGDASSPVGRVSIEAVAPSGAQSQPVYDAAAPSGARSQPVYDAATRAPRRTPLWIAVVGVPLAGLAAFLIVGATGSKKAAPAEPPATSAPLVAATTPREPTTPRIAPARTDDLDVPKTTAIAPPPTPQGARVSTRPSSQVAPDPPLRTPPVAKSQLRLIIAGASAPDIFIDGNRSTAEVKLRPGLHDVEIRARGMQPQKLEVDVAPTGVTTKRISLSPTPKLKAEPPKVKAEPPKVKAEPRKVKAEPPKGKAEPPKVKAEPPKGKAEPPKVKAEPPKVRAEPPKVKAEPPKVKAEPPPKSDGSELMSPGSLNSPPPRH